MRRLLVTQEVVDATLEHFQRMGREGAEGLAVWVGPASESFEWQATGVVIPKQTAIRSDHGIAVTITGDELHRLNIYLYRNNLRLLAQVHSHPQHAYHSEMDDEYSIATELGALSVVVPFFGYDQSDVSGSAIYRLISRRWWEFLGRPARWRRIDPSTVQLVSD